MFASAAQQLAIAATTHLILSWASFTLPLWVIRAWDWTPMLYGNFHFYLEIVHMLILSCNSLLSLLSLVITRFISYICTSPFFTVKVHQCHFLSFICVNILTCCFLPCIYIYIYFSFYNELKFILIGRA